MTTPEEASRRQDHATYYMENYSCKSNGRIWDQRWPSAEAMAPVIDDIRVIWLDTDAIRVTETDIGDL